MKDSLLVVSLQVCLLLIAGGQLTTTTEVENFPGFPDSQTGPELMESMRKQSIRFGTKVVSETITRVDFSIRPYRIWVEGKDKDDADAIYTKSVIT